MKWINNFGRHDAAGKVLVVPDAFEVTHTAYWNLGCIPRPRGFRKLWIRIKAWWWDIQWKYFTKPEPELGTPIEEDDVPEELELPPDPYVHLEVQCQVCGYEWLASFFPETPRLECKRCGFMTPAPPVPLQTSTEEPNDE